MVDTESLPNRPLTEGEFENFVETQGIECPLAFRSYCTHCDTEGVVDALGYLMLFHRHPGDTQPWIDSMSYGWGIGHPNHPFEGTITTLVEGEYDIWASTAIEHAMHADQHAATDLLENLFAAGIVSDPAQLLRIVGAIDRGYYPDSSDHWDWEALYPESHVDGFDTMNRRNHRLAVDRLPRQHE